MSGTTFLPYKMKFGEIGFLKIFYLVEIDVDKLVEVGVETLDDVEADDEVDALQTEMIYYLVNISAGARPWGGGGASPKNNFRPSGLRLGLFFSFAAFVRFGLCLIPFLIFSSLCLSLLIFYEAVCFSVLHLLFLTSRLFFSHISVQCALFAVVIYYIKSVIVLFR